MDGFIDGLMRLIIARGDEDYAVDVESILGAVSSRTKVVFLCSPNNPSGNLVPEEDVRAIAESTRGLVFVDEAYVEFADSSLAHRLWNHARVAEVGVYEGSNTV